MWGFVHLSSCPGKYSNHIMFLQIEETFTKKAIRGNLFFFE